ncbi:5'/3'-nucleotidase SurE [Sodalis sp. RH22]|uniref:5'/3'-nucleotidase SurE n=2 Tax=unclassified Sodalis (in: enterobacteria) TaxID=2636512 RepID=UPI0039B54DE2
MENNPVMKKVNRVLLTNDDGIDAPGLELLAKAAQEIAEEVWIVAPAQDKSGVANSLSMREPVRVINKGPRRFAVYGTPADCVAYAVHQAMLGSPPDLVLSGVNNGSNLGFETLLSGTVGAAMTGMLSGIPSIALSQNRDPDQPVNWDSATRYLIPTLRHVLQATWDRQVCLNVNFPDMPADRVKGIRVTKQGMGNVDGMMVIPAKDPHGEDYFWIRVQHGGLERPENSELKLNDEGYISVTPLTFERTEMKEFQRLGSLYGQDF